MLNQNLKNVRILQCFAHVRRDLLLWLFVWITKKSSDYLILFAKKKSSKTFLKFFCKKPIPILISAQIIKSSFMYWKFMFYLNFFYLFFFYFIACKSISVQTTLQQIYSPDDCIIYLWIMYYVLPILHEIYCILFCYSHSFFLFFSM